MSLVQPLVQATPGPIIQQDILIVTIEKEFSEILVDCSLAESLYPSVSDVGTYRTYDAPERTK